MVKVKRDKRGRFLRGVKHSNRRKKSLANLGNGDRGEEGEKKWRSVEERPKNGALRYLIVLSLKQGGS